jgi:hypothetical protein
LTSPHEYVKRAAADKQAWLDPDATTAAMEGSGEVNINPATEKLKHLKGQIEEMGGSVHKNKLDNKGAGVPAQLFDGKGMLSAQSIDNYLESLPKERYGVTWGKRSGCQRHDREAPQKVLQLNLTNAHINQLKQSGLWEEFQRQHAMSYASGHPVLRHTLGWARIDDTQPDHWHVDEIQSDLGQGTVRAISKAVENGQMSDETANKKMDNLKKIMKVLQGPFKSINHAIFGAVHDMGRKKDIKATSMDNLEDQARQSGMQTTSSVGPSHVQQFVEGRSSTYGFQKKVLTHWAKGHGLVDQKGNLLSPTAFKEKWKEEHGDNTVKLPIPVPGHMNSTYKQIPEDAGYKVADKKATMPNTTAGETHFQLRKLVKSLTELRNLVKLLEAIK